eukprot:TRINITY_DN1156_c0_g2_i1.p1 TRINITY_DN1156_c0_g2~~TRINITY_DN1156_c0_g2_i1.p1  ORF type:complete len:357 (+),score=121.62 TRINITY_DN1156_c0_g2_i1:120-1190(+)
MLRRLVTTNIKRQNIYLNNGIKISEIEATKSIFLNNNNNKYNNININSPLYSFSVTRNRYDENKNKENENDEKKKLKLYDDSKKCKIVVVTSGKGGVGKTTTAANIGYGLATHGKKTCLIDFDVGLRNLDIHLGMERRIIYDFINVINKECTLRQALVRDKKVSDLYLLAASQTKDKTALTEEGVEEILNELVESDFDYVICDSPAGIESGAFHALLYSDIAMICTNPELSSVRDSDKMIGFIDSNSKRALNNRDPVHQELIITRYNPERVEKEDMLSINDISEMLGLDCIGLIPECETILNSINFGRPVINQTDSNAGVAYSDLVERFLGNKDIPLKFTTAEKKSFFQRLMNKMK